MYYRYIAISLPLYYLLFKVTKDTPDFKMSTLSSTEDIFQGVSFKILRNSDSLLVVNHFGRSHPS